MSVENVKAQVLSCKSYAFRMQNIIFWRVKPMFLYPEKHGFRAFQEGEKKEKAIQKRTSN